MLEVFHNMLTSTWEKEMVPKDFKDAMIVSLYKVKAIKLNVKTAIASHFPSLQEKI